MGHGADPEQPSRSMAEPNGEPPDPCGLCDGCGTLGPRGKVAPWDSPPWMPR
jgi:hypothetical protein